MRFDKRTSGVDPSLFSQALMYYASKHAVASWVGEPDFDPIEETSAAGRNDKTLSPSEIMSLAYKDVLNEPSVECGENFLARHAFLYSVPSAGSSTACIVNVDAQSGKLSAAK